MLVVILGAVVGTAVATARWWLPPAASAEAAGIDGLFRILFVITSIVFVAVQLALVLAAWRFAGRGRAEHWHDNPRLETAWTVLTAVILGSLTVAGGSLWVRLHSPPPEDALVVNVWAEQFGWRYQYPGPDGKFGRTRPALVSARNPIGLDSQDPAAADDVVTQELHLAAGQPVLLRLHAKDVIHSFFVPELRFKQDAVPGRVVERHLTPTTPGTFTVACAELCGVGHFVMRSTVVVEASREALESWLRAQAPGLQLASR